MIFIPGAVAATAYELGEMCEEEKKRLEELSAAPATYERVLQKMDEEAQDVIDEDEEKLKKEAKKIANLQHKISKEERKYLELEQELAVGELNEAELEKEKLEKAEVKLTKLQKGRDDESPVKEKIEEVFHDAKEYVIGALDNVADFAHLMFADDKELKAHEPTESKTQKKLRAAAKHIEDLRKELDEKRTAMMKEDDELLRKEAQKIEHLQQQLDDEVQKYAEIEADLISELQYEARIREEEQKLKDLQLME